MKKSKTMPHPLMTICLKQLNVWTKIILVFAILVMGGLFVLLLRLNQGPIDLTGFKPTIEKALSINDQTISIGQLGLSWPSLSDPILLDASQIQRTDAKGQTLTIKQASLSLSGLAALRGQIKPNFVRLYDLEFNVNAKSGMIDFSLPSSGSETPTLTRRDIAQKIQDLLSPEKQTDGIFSELEDIELRGAVLRMDQDILALMDVSLKKSRQGLKGDVLVYLPGDGTQSTFKGDIVYRRKQKDFTVDAILKNFNLTRFGKIFGLDTMLGNSPLIINGTFLSAFDSALSIQKAMGNVTIPEGTLTLPELYDTPVALKDIVLDGHLNRVTEQLEIKNFTAQVNDIALTASAVGTIKGGNIRLPLTLTIPEAPMEGVRALVPRSHYESPAGEWLTQKLSKGRLYDVVLTTDFIVTADTQTGQRDAAMNHVIADFKSEGLTVAYSDTLMPVTEVRASGRYENDTLTIKSDFGKVGDITGKDVTMTITNLSIKGGGQAKIKIKAQGPLKTALKYVSDEPIAVADKLGFDINKVQGDVTFDLNLKFPTLKDLPKEEVIVVLDGSVNNLFLPDIVKNLSLQAGPYALSYKDGAIALKGSGTLGAYPVTVDWLQYLDSTGRNFESRIQASLSTDQALRALFGVGLEDYISGAIPVTVTYVDKGKTETLSLQGDLTPTHLHLDVFDFEKKPAIAGSLSLNGILEQGILKTIDQLSIKTDNFSVTNGAINFRQLQNGDTDIASGKFPDTILGKTSASVSFEITPDNVMKITSEGPVIDLVPFVKPEKKQAAQRTTKDPSERAMKISASAPQALGAYNEKLSNTKFYIETNPTGDITHLEMDAEVGKGSMYVRFKPEASDGKRTFRMESTDAGATLKAFGLYDKMRDGTITIYGVPQGNDLKGDLFGKARIDNFSLRKTPVLAKLLGAMSLPGAIDILNNDGLKFGRLESDFEWLFREGGNFLVVKDGRTSGSTVGLTFDGSVDQAKNDIAIKGTIVPISGVNAVIGNIPIVGDILTGGSGSLIAATYTMSGSTADPQVVVNPLSVLTPGFLRRILFEGEAKIAPSDPAITPKKSDNPQ